MLRYYASGNRRFDLDPVPPVQRLNWEFYVALQGRCGLYFSKKERFPLKERHLWLCPPDLVYGWWGDTAPCDRMVFQFARVPEEVSRLITPQTPFLSAQLSEGDVHYLKENAAMVQRHFENPTAVSRLVFDRTLLDLSILLLKKQPLAGDIPLRQLSEHRIERAMAWYSSYMMKNPTVDQVADAVHLSSGHLRKLFHEIKGLPPHAVFRELQIRRALHLLSSTADTTEEIARQCGFRSASDFSRAFKKEIGCAPNVWRRSLSPGEQTSSGRLRKIVWTDK